MEKESKLAQFFKSTKVKFKSLDHRFVYFSSFQFIFWAMMFPVSFFMVFLMDQGFNDVQIGVTLAINSLVTLITQPIWGLVSDKMGSKQRTLVILFAGTILFSVLTTFVTGVIAITILLNACVLVFRNSTTPITESWLIQEVNTPNLDGTRLNYGPIRLWGSIGYAIAGFIFSFIFNNLGLDPKYSFLLSAIVCVFVLYYTTRYKQDPQSDTASAPRKVNIKISELKPMRLLKNYYFITFAVVYMLICIPSNFSMQYISQLLKHLGGAPTFIGFISSLRALCEIPTLIFSKRIIGKLGFRNTIFLIAALMLGEQFSYVICTQVWQVVLFQMIYGCLNGLLLSSAMSYLFTLVPRELSATAQTVCTASCSIIAIVSNLVSGLIIERWGIRAIYTISTTGIALAFILFAATLFIGKLAKIPHYDAEKDPISKEIMQKMLESN